MPFDLLIEIHKTLYSKVFDDEDVKFNADCFFIKKLYNIKFTFPSKKLLCTLFPIKGTDNTNYNQLAKLELNEIDFLPSNFIARCCPNLKVLSIRNERALNSYYHPFGSLIHLEELGRPRLRLCASERSPRLNAIGDMTCGATLRKHLSAIATTGLLLWTSQFNIGLSQLPSTIRAKCFYTSQD